METRSVMPPHNVEAERAVIGSMLLGGRQAIARAMMQLTRDDFYRVENGIAFDAIVKLHEQGMKVDAVGVRDELMREGLFQTIGGFEYFHAIADAVVSAANIDLYAAVVHGRAIERQAQELGRQIAEAAGDWDREPQELVSIIGDRVRKLDAFAIRGRNHGITIGDAVAEGVARLNQKAEAARAGKDLSFKSGLAPLDLATGGAEPGEYIVVASQSGVGKTAIAAQWGMNAAARQGAAVVVHTAEINARRYAMRLAYSLAGLDSHKCEIAPHRMTKEETKKLSNAASRIAAMPMLIRDEAAQTVGELASACRVLKSEGRCDFLIVDYIQLLRPTGSGRNQTREQEVAGISRELRMLSNSVDIPVVALSQLNEEGQTRESRGVFHDADTLIVITTNERRQGMKPQGVTFEVQKSRFGPTGEFRMFFDFLHTKFLTPQEYDQMEEESSGSMVL